MLNTNKVEQILRYYFPQFHFMTVRALLIGVIGGLLSWG